MRLVLIFIISLPVFNIYSQFVDITESANVLHTCASPVLIGGGAGFIDVNRDGWLDLVFTGGQDVDRLYINTGNESFIDASKQIKKNSVSDITTSVLVGDLNNDGWDDMVITTLNNDRGQILLINDTSGGFNLLKGSGALSKKGSATGGILYDLNNDGLLDIYIINYIEEHNFILDDDGEVMGYDHSCEPNHWYQNMGGLVFQEMASELGIEGAGCGLAVANIPIGTGAQHGIYIANDFGEWIQPNELFLEIDNEYLNLADSYQLDIGLYAMGIAIGDYDNDLDFDLYVTNLGKNYFLEFQEGKYIERASEFQIDNTIAESGELTTGWGTFFFDYDNDSDLDLYVSNGYIRAAAFIKNALLDHSKLYKNEGGGDQFIDVTRQNNLEIPGLNRGAIFGDINNDGRLDIVSTYVNYIKNQGDITRSYRIYKNIALPKNYIEFLLKDLPQYANPYGAVLKIKHGGDHFVSYLYSGGTHASQNSQMVHFGLGSSEVVDSIWITWPDGDSSIFTELTRNYSYLIDREANSAKVLGCKDVNANNFEPMAEIDYGCLGGTTTSIIDTAQRNKCGFDVKVQNTSLSILSTNNDVRLGGRIKIYSIIGKLLQQIDISQDFVRTGAISLNLNIKGVYVIIYESKEGCKKIIKRLELN